MAYDQGYFQAPQRAYTGGAARRPGPPHGYPQQQYPPQQYDQYAQDGYGYDEYNNGFAQDWNGDGSYQDMNGDGRGNGYLQQNQYPPQQEYYDGGRGGAMGGRGGRGSPMDYQGGYDQRGGGQGRGYPPASGRGGRPPSLDRAATSDPGSRMQPRKPLRSPTSPNAMAWDNPFPVFPGMKKKTTATEEEEIVRKMAGMDTGGPQNRPRTVGSKGSQDKWKNGETDDFGNPIGSSSASMDDYARPSMDSQRGQGRYPQGPSRGPNARSPQGYPDSQRGPPQGFPGPSRQNTYGGDAGYQPYVPSEEEFSPPGRSMTMPTNLAVGPQNGRQPMRNQPPMGVSNTPRQAATTNSLGSSAPYNGPIGRGMPPRPSTTNAMRPPPQRIYTDQPPMPQQQYPPANAYGNTPGGHGHQKQGSLGEFYDSYYDTSQDPRRSQPDGSPIPDFDAVSAGPSGTHRRGNSIDDHLQAGAQQRPSFEPQSGPQYQAYQGQPLPQSAEFNMVGGAPSVPNVYPGYQDDQYGQYNDQYGGYEQGQEGYGPPRSASTGRGGLPSGPKNGFVGLPSGPGPRSQSLPKQTPPNPDAIPSHPAPVRAGLMQSSPSNQPNNKPPPVRNYSNVSQASQKPASAAQPAPEKVATPPVTGAELEQLRGRAKANPNDQTTQFTLAKKLVEASEKLVAKLPDQRARGKAREKYVFDAHKILKKLVNAQHSDAMFYLADCYGRGALGLETDNKEAFSLYQAAAKAGHPAAAYRTAVCCELGNEEGGGTRKDPIKTIQWYRRAATLGDTPAMYKMGMIQLKGLLGQPKNQHEAVVWLKRAAERADSENPHALHELALLYEAPQTNDSPIVRDEQYSFELFNHAADLGYKFAQFRLGCTFEYGLFNQQIDPRQSIMWYSRAAVQEEHQAEMALSGWYLTGAEKILQQSDTEAYLWARKAALAGLAKAEYAMGYFTEVGIGCPANLEDAKRWYWRAAAQNFPKARERLEDLKKGGKQQQRRSRERISRSKVGKQNEGECVVM